MCQSYASVVLGDYDWNADFGPVEQEAGRAGRNVHTAVRPGEVPAWSPPLQIRARPKVPATRRIVQEEAVLLEQHGVRCRRIRIPEGVTLGPRRPKGERCLACQD